MEILEVRTHFASVLGLGSAWAGGANAATAEKGRKNCPFPKPGLYGGLGYIGVALGKNWILDAIMLLQQSVKARHMPPKSSRSTSEARPKRAAAPGAKAHIKKRVVVPAFNPIDGKHTVASTDETLALQNREILFATLKMLSERGHRYDVSRLISSIEETNDAESFQIAVLMPEYLNPLRDIIASSYTRREPPTLRVLLSLLVQNNYSAPGASKSGPEAETVMPTFTAVFFADRKSQQVAKQLVEIFFDALLALKASAFRVTETIFITPVQFSSESDANLKAMGMGCFTQIFRDEEVLAPATLSVLAPRIRILTPEEKAEFRAKNKNFRQLSSMPQIMHTDAHLKLLGVQPDDIVEILRPPIVPGNMRRTELTYSRVI